MITPPTSVLLVEDNPGDARLVELLLEDVQRTRYTVTRVSSMSEALPHLSAAHRPDVVLLDLGLPDSHGLETIVRARSASTDTPLVVLTGFDDEALALQALDAGAQDYLVKGKAESDSIARTIRHAVQRQRLQAEAEHARERQLQLKDEFLSHVSHELRSPLTAVSLLVTVVRDALPAQQDDQHREYLDVAVRNLKQLATMIDDLLEVTRAETGHMKVEPRRMALEPVIGDVLETIRVTAADKGVTLVADGAIALPAVFADPDRVRQVVVNLVDNALKFTPHGGRISVTVAAEGDVVRVSVADTGCGIAGEDCARIFDRLYQVESDAHSSRRGLGLGLYICSQIVERHGGSIQVESEAGEGSTFSFTLPVFSLHTLLAPLFSPPPGAPNGLAVLTIDLVRPEHGLSDESWSAVTRSARSLVQSSLLPDLDVVLPIMASTSAADTVVVVARADESGVDVLAARLRQKLARYERLETAGVRWAVRPVVMDTGTLPPDALAGHHASRDGLDLAVAIVESLCPTHPVESD